MFSRQTEAILDKRGGPGRRDVPQRPVPKTRSLEERLLAWFIGAHGQPPVDIVLWDGRRVRAGGREPVATLRIGDRATLRSLVWNPSVGFGEAYSDGRIRVDGDLVALVSAVNRGGGASPRSPYRLRRIVRQLRGPVKNTLGRSRNNVHEHYDIGNEFYALWLGETMAYTCAYYPVPDATLDAAQVAKMEHVCRKLRLAPGESVVEAGCGWGSLALHMAQHHGVRVRAFNISREQVEWARERARSAGLAGRVEFVEDDYRAISGHYDAFVSVGMLEHVGPDHYRELGRIARDALGGAGRGLIHSIGRNRPWPFDEWISRRIFPGAYPPTLREMMDIFEPWNLSVLDVENLRLHYAQTLRHWLARYEAAAPRVLELFDERFVRAWRLYLAGSIAAFATGQLQLFQILFAPGTSHALPWTRADIYRD